mmetsp:Transcript_3457/g.9854  ORF Transcript_3457/g.9854 Transcript_3457/m.9854 type:complete len:2914 (-) Transcript_3457:98-8839(-)|eukprot:CAMPEP_0119558468 /NCGR_PEP_ID=MMETSP1352-20130426/10806_1 /TAXON_ID=265584 /ORGANISM="Stauroneis constricta, Strain CCMP1120" /LENGTH=2913 /DNA_ID=CAMNT_0007605839 /DNA_START=402 /DNA_END=9146 /DNA_ORIENTATION=-
MRHVYAPLLQCAILLSIIAVGKAQPFDAAAAATTTTSGSSSSDLPSPVDRSVDAIEVQSPPASSSSSSTGVTDEEDQYGHSLSLTGLLYRALSAKGRLARQPDDNGSMIDNENNNDNAVAQTQQQQQRHRKLGDFDEFNELFKDARIRLPDAYINPFVVFARLRLSMDNIQCSGITIGNIEITHTVTSLRQIDMSLAITGISLQCDLIYDYTYGKVRSGDGSASGTVSGADVTAELTVMSTNFDMLPPSNAILDNCEAVLGDLSFISQGDLYGDILEAFQDSLKGTFTERIRDIACAELEELDTTFVQGLLDVANEALDPYLATMSSDVTNPLFLESSSNLDAEASLLNFQETGTIIGAWFDQVLQEADALLGTVIDDPKSGAGVRDLGVNVFLRDYLLEDDRSFTVDLEKSGFDTTLYDGHDQLSETTIVLNAVKMFGLDTFTKFEPLVAIGKYTLQNELIWDYLTLEFDITVNVKPSTLPDSILVDPTSDGFSERIKVDIGLDTADLTASLFLAIDQDKLGSITIGPLLNTQNLLPCLLSTVADVKISGLDVEILNIRPPTLQGFISPGIDRIVTSSVEALFDMYKGVIRRAIPSIFQTTMRDIVNDDIIHGFMDEPVNVVCPSVVSENAFIDFRDLLLDSSLSSVYGGSGDEPYGDLASTVFNLIREQLLEAESDTDNSLKLNSILIQPVTKRQSGVEGMLQFPGALFDFVKTDIDLELARSFISKFQIAVYNTRISNLDTFKAPAQLLLPTNHPFILANQLNIGPEAGRPLNMTIGFKLIVEGDEEDSALSMNNDMDMSFSVDAASLTGSFIAKIDEARLQNFALQDVLNYHCWLATIPPPQLDSDGNRVDGTENDFHLSIRDALLQFANMEFDVNFLSSNSPGIVLVPEMIELMKSKGVLGHLQQRLKQTANDMMNSQWVRSLIDQWLVNAPKFCPHDPNYDENAVYNDFGLESFPSLEEETIDTLFFATAVAAPVAVMILAESQRLEPPEPTHPMSAQQAWTNEVPAVDWANMTGTLGTFVDSAIEELTGYLGRSVTDDDAAASAEGNDLGINIELRDWFLEDDGSLFWEFDDVKFEVPGFEIGLTKVKLSGVDSFTKFDIWNVIAPQTFENFIAIEELRLELVLTHRNLDTSVTKEFTANFALQDIDATAFIFLALDKEAFGNLEVGSFFKTREILPCFLTATEQLEITQFLATIGNIDKPVFTGLESDSDLIVKAFIDDLFATYMSKFLAGALQVFDDPVRKLLNGFAETLIESASCDLPVIPDDSKFIDFERFFDSDLELYGDVPPLIRRLVDTELLVLDRSSGLPKINSILIDPITERQSGEEGALSFPGSIFGTGATSFPNVGLDAIEIKAFDPTIFNVNTLGSPIEILEPNGTSGSLLDNRAIIGYEGSPFQFLMKALIDVSGDPALSMNNNLDFMVEVVNTDLLAVVLAQIEPETLLKFPLKDLGSADCWFALMSSSVADGSIASGLAFDYISLALASVRFDITCSSCTSKGLFALPDILATLEDEGISDMVEKHVIELGLDLLQSEYLQDILDMYVIDGAKKCPSNPNYDSDFSNSDAATQTKFPALPYESLETIAFAAAVGVQIGTVVVAESHADYVLVESDPLSAQSTFNASEDMRLMNFTDFENLLGAWADVGIDRLLRYFNKRDDKGDLQINSILRSFILDDDDGSFSLEFEDLKAATNGMSVQLKEIRVQGLDSITAFDALDFIGAQTVANDFSWDNLSIEVVVTIVTENTDATMRRLETSEDLIVSLDISDIDLSLALFMAIDLDALGTLELGSILEIKHILPCFLSTAKAAEVTKLELSVGSIDSFTVKGFRSEALDSAMQETSAVILREYGELIKSSLPAVFDTTVKALLNNWAEYYMNNDDNFICKRVAMDVEKNAFIDLRDLLLKPDASKALNGEGSAQYGDLFSTAFELVQDLVFEVDESTGRSKANSVMIGPLSKDQSNTTGTFAFESDLINSGTRLQVGGLDATIDFRASNARIENLDTMGYPVSIIQPMMDSGYDLNNSGTFGIENKPLRFATRFLISLIGDDDLQLRNEVDIELDLYSSKIFLQALLRIAEQRFRSFPLQNLLDFNCWLATIPAPELDERGVRLADSDVNAALVDLAASVADIRLNITCIECSSPEMYDLADFLSSPEAREDVTKVGNDLLDYVETMLTGNFASLQIDRMLSEATKKCPHLSSFDDSFSKAQYQSFATEPRESNISFLMAVGATCLALVFAVAFLMCFIKCIVRRRHKRWLGTLPDYKVERILRIQRRDRDMQDELNETTHAMFASPVVPRWLRLSMPFIIIGNIGFFMSGHLSLGATVNIQGTLAGETFSVEQFFEFSMAKSTIDIWNAGGRELAVMIFLLSGLWPYSKQLITLALWFIPPTRIPVAQRGSILIWLDWLAKWSMVDIFVLVISLAAFRVSVQSPDVGFLPADFYSLDLLVVPLWGLYANMIAQLISQVSSHFIIHYHRKIVDVATKKYKEANSIEDMVGPSDFEGGEQPSTPSAVTKLATQRTRLSNYKYSRPHRGEHDEMVPRRGVGLMVTMMTAMLFGLVIAGCIFPSFSLELLGLVGLAVESGQGFSEANTKHTVFTIIKLLFEQAEFLDTTSDFVGLGTLSVLLLFSVLIVPLIQALALMIQWFVPATPKLRWRIAVLNETLQAWQYAEVYLIAIFVASWQLGPVSEFMINSYCDSLQATFNELVYFGVLKSEDAQCFSVQSQIETGSYILAGGAALLALLNTFVMKAVTQFFRDQAEMERRALDAEIAIGQGLKPQATLSEEGSEYDIDVDDDLHLVVQPVPVLFTDTFRWTLRSLGGRRGSVRSSRKDSQVSTEHGSNDGEALALVPVYKSSKAEEEDEASRIADQGKILVYDTGEDQPARPMIRSPSPMLDDDDDMHDDLIIRGAK